jgi:hypothetical protein
MLSFLTTGSFINIIMCTDDCTAPKIRKSKIQKQIKLLAYFCGIITQIQAYF